MASAPQEFIDRIPVVERFADVADRARYVPLPDDWAVAVADVQGSTAAIREGRYKEVNVVGVSTIAAVQNAIRPQPALFVFGGDGASMCVPAAAVEATRAALIGMRALSQQQFGLTLRIGIVPVPVLVAGGASVLVARFQSSPTYIQSMFAGGGMALAEKLVKDPHSTAYRIPDENSAPSPDCSGMECRWNEIPSPHGETVAVLVQATSREAAEDARIYRDVIATIDQHYGGEVRSHPVIADGLTLARAATLTGERRVRTYGSGALSRLAYAAGLGLQQSIGRVLLVTGVPFAGVHWGRYRQEVVDNTDRRKFDDTLRLVLAGTAEQRRALEAWLESRYRAGDLVYGIQVGTAALMTCLIGKRTGGDHLHFVDGAGGGYALAAAELKARLKARGPDSK
jgi:hypothetical protein